MENDKTDVTDVKEENVDTVNPDLETQNQALQELLKETQATMQAMKDELVEVKKANAKMVAQLDISNATPKTSVEEIINSNFNRYLKK